MRIKRTVALLFAGFLLSLLLPPIYAQEKRADKKPVLSQEAAQLIGKWEIVNTKEPSQPYRTGYKGRPFVNRGPNAFTLIMEYQEDGSFRRISRVGDNETVHEGSWTLNGHELQQQRKGSRDPEVMYVRFDGPDQYTSIEVYEGTPDPGLFAQFKKVP
ncbi:MAG: hypothetical protein HY913_10050 [Desulfomonile tiedjei]|nr:hypothetical protein [Desulfomonile tiedjei]